MNFKINYLIIRSPIIFKDEEIEDIDNLIKNIILKNDNIIEIHKDLIDDYIEKKEFILSDITDINKYNEKKEKEKEQIDNLSKQLIQRRLKKKRENSKNIEHNEKNHKDLENERNYIGYYLNEINKFEIKDFKFKKDNVIILRRINTILELDLTNTGINEIKNSVLKKINNNEEIKWNNLLVYTIDTKEKLNKEDIILLNNISKQFKKYTLDNELNFDFHLISTITNPIEKKIFHNYMSRKLEFDKEYTYENFNFYSSFLNMTGININKFLDNIFNINMIHNEIELQPKHLDKIKKILEKNGITDFNEIDEDKIDKKDILEIEKRIFSINYIKSLKESNLENNDEKVKNLGQKKSDNESDLENKCLNFLKEGNIKNLFFKIT